MAGLVLAAGRSSRTGGPFKLLLPYRGETVVGAVVGAASRAGLEPVLVVVGHRAPEVRAALEGSGADAVENPDFRAGLGSSLAAGIRAASGHPDIAAVAVLLGDEPGLSPDVVRAAVAAWREGGAAAVRVVYRDRPGHPVVLGRSVLARLGGLEGEEGAVPFLEDAGETVRNFRVDVAAPPDIDTMADYRAVMESRREEESERRAGREV